MQLTRVDAVGFIKKYKPESTIKWNGKWLISQCIIDDFEPHHSNGDKNPSAGLNIMTGQYSCFVYADRSISFKHLCKIIGKNYEFVAENRTPDDLRKALDEKWHIKEDAELDLSIYSDAHHQYMTKVRHFSDEVLDRAQVKYDQYSDRILIPIFEDGKCIAVQRRRLKDKTPDGRYVPKYENTKGFDKSMHIYHIEDLDIDEPLLVVESVMSVFRAWDYGFKNCCALFGSRISQWQLEFLKRFRCIILDLDGDESGMHGVPKAIRGLTNCNLFILETHPLGSKDIADIPKSRFMKLIASPLTPFEWKLKYGGKVS